MARAFRFSGYLIDSTQSFATKMLLHRAIRDLEKENDNGRRLLQQFHVDVSDEFDLDGEDVPNCDLSLIARHFDNTKTDYKFDRPIPEKDQIYRHFKNKLVTVLAVSRDTETGALSVVYEHNGTVWNRPIEMFMSEVDKSKYPDVKQKYRFELVDL